MQAAVSLQSEVERFVSAPVRRMLIDGKWVEAASGKTFETPNPATGEVLARVAAAGPEDVDRAVRAARRAFDDGPWPHTPPNERERFLLKVADLIEAHADELAQLETLDNGKPFMESRHVDIPAAAATFRYYAGWVNKIYGETNPSDETFFNFTLREPVGVCGQIIPWNFPLLMAAWKLGPALACGNTSVLKPAEQTPLTALRLGELLLEAGLPDGVVNIVPGFGETAGRAIVRHPMVDKIAFTGSTEVGKEIHRETASTLKRLSLALGGKSPNIVFSDAEPDARVQGVSLGVVFDAGQVRCAGRRVLASRKLRPRGAPGQRHHLRPRRRRLDPRREQGAPGGARHPRGHGVGQLLQRVRPGLALRRLQAERLRARAGPLRARPLHPGEERVAADMNGPRARPRRR